MTPTIRTIDGDIFDLLHPEDSPITINAIAHGLSHCCRFAGHCRQFYSVAEHSLLVASLVPPEDALHALLHDAAEAYLGDVTRPLKALLPEYKIIEARVEAAIFARFGLPAEIPASVHRADLIALATEKRDLMVRPADAWSLLDKIDARPERITFTMTPEAARANFLWRFYELRAGACAGFFTTPSADLNFYGPG